MNKKAKKAAKKIAKADRVATHHAATYRDAPAVKALGLLAEVGDQPQLIATSIGAVVIGLATKRRDLVRGGIRMLAAHLIATAAKTAVKRSVDRTRPSRAIGQGHRFEAGDSHDHELNSFPSGHSAGAVAVARAAAHEIGGAAVPAAVGAGLIASAQPPVGNHYISDVVVGAAIGWAAEALVSAVFDRIDVGTIDHRVGAEEVEAAAHPS